MCDVGRVIINGGNKIIIIKKLIVVSYVDKYIRKKYDIYLIFSSKMNCLCPL